MQEAILIIYLVVSIALIGIILLQQGKGAEMGASFGAGGANTVFGAAGSGNVLTKTTTILAILFFAIALSISYLNSEPEVLVDEVLDENIATEQAKEAALPVATDDALESQVAPEQTDTLATQTPATKETLEEVSAKVEEKQEETAKKEGENKDN